MITCKKFMLATRAFLLFSISSLCQLHSASKANASANLVGDVTGLPAATIVSKVGGVSAAKIASGANAANDATSSNVPGTIVMRDSSGNFSASKITLNELDLFNTSTFFVNGNVSVQGNIALKSGKTLYVDHIVGSSNAYIKEMAVTNMIVYGNYLAPSDECLKTDITDLDSERCLALVNQLVPHEFDYIPEVKKALGDDGSRHVGFIAQELAKVDPRFVHIAQGTQKVGDLTKEDLALVKQELFVPLLVGALKAELAEIQRLQGRVDVLEARHAAH